MIKDVLMFISKTTKYISVLKLISSWGLQIYFFELFCFYIPYTCPMTWPKELNRF